MLSISNLWPHSMSCTSRNRRMPLSALTFTILQFALALMSLSIPSVVAQLPYNPSYILRNDSFLYIFRPESPTSTQYELASIEISSKITLSDLSHSTVSATLPFLASSDRRPFTPVLEEGGNITVYTGECGGGPDGTQIWTFVPGGSEERIEGTWKQEEVTYSEDKAFPPSISPNFLNGGISFSSLAEPTMLSTNVYFFGGLCPTDGEEDSWQSSANYSNSMVVLQPKKTSTTAINYRLDISSSRGPPIAEAGFTLTGLAPTYSNRSDGTQTQQQNFVLVGGHTKSAFINMSQIALFALPQQSWTFLPVDQLDPQRTDLTVRTDVSEIEPRSGHTAVLTPDGQQIVVCGGWVGDVDTPAYPELAVLHVGDGFGGNGSWEWTAPSTSGSGLPENKGIYGHGAVMLPGGVMMITGGYSIGGSSSRRRQSGPAPNTQTFLFDVESNTWITDYIPPPRTNPPEEAQSRPLSKPSQKAGLGAGLGIGAVAVMGLLVFYFWYTRRLKNQRDVREKQLRDLALGAHRYTAECLSPGLDGRGGQIDAVDYFDDLHDPYQNSSARHLQNQGWRRTNGRDAERTGLLVEIPSPTRGLRRSLGGRPNNFAGTRGVRGSGYIHPIDELEEEEHEYANERKPLTPNPEMHEQTNRASLFSNAPVLQPSGSSQPQFSLHPAPKLPTSEGAVDPQNANDWHLNAGSSLDRRRSPNSAGRVSPTKSERTRSDLSERSTRSNLSSTSTNASISRTLSIRSAALINSMNPFRTPQDSPTNERAPSSHTGGWSTPADPRTRSFTSIRSTRPNTANADGDSFTTAKTSFMQLQAEGEALLGGNPERSVRPGTGSTSSHSNTFAGAKAYPATPIHISESPTSQTRPRRKSWLGNVRRVLGRSSSLSGSPNIRNMAPEEKFEPYHDALTSETLRSPQSKRFSHPNAYGPGSGSGSPPRRAVSDASLWRSKRGKKDWMDDEIDTDGDTRWRRNEGDDWGAPEDRIDRDRESERRKRLSGMTGATTDDEDEDWDVEAAVERRVVQVMFTVPKARLRVVNAEVERDDSSVFSVPVEKSKKDRDQDAEGERDMESETKAENGSSPGSPGRVRELVDLFQTRDVKSRSPASSIRSGKTRS